MIFSMIEVRIHGLGGQGAVTAAQLLAIAAFHDGKYAQAFPSFGVERRGAPATSFVRIDDKPINIREQIYYPDYILCFEPGLIKVIDIKKGVKKEAIVNSHYKIEGCHTYDLSAKAREILGKPIVNTLILGAFAGQTNVVSLKGLKMAIDQVFAGKKDLAAKNKQAVEESYNEAR